MTQEMKVIFSIGVLTLAILFGGVVLLSSNEQPNNNAPVDKAVLGRNAKHTVSSENAKVTIVEFADFQCPACARTQPVISQILEDYKGNINFTYRHFPLPQHRYAVLAARAAEAAGEEGKFWEMYKVLYERQTEWQDHGNAAEVFTVYATELQLNKLKFTERIKSEKYDDAIEQDKNDAITLGVNSTPTFFINGKKMYDAPTYQNLKKVIDEAIVQK